MATACCSLKPSALRRCTNLRVSKWCDFWLALVVANVRRASWKLAAYGPLCRREELLVGVGRLWDGNLVFLGDVGGDESVLERLLVAEVDSGRICGVCCHIGFTCHRVRKSCCLTLVV